MKLKEIADVSMGHSFRSRLEPVDGGCLAVIQMKDLTEDNRLAVDGVARIDLSDVNPRQLVAIEDIVLRSRGQTNTAVRITEDVGDAVVAAPLLRIRARERVLPAYLAWFINLPASQAWIASHAKGTAVKMISKQAIEGMEVVVPPMERQRAIAELAGLASSEQQLLKELAGKRKQYMEGILMQAASGSQ